MKITIKKHILLFLALCICVLFSACSKVEDIPLVIVDSEDETMSFNLIPVTRDDVTLTKEISCSYIQTASQEVSFSITGKFVNKVYVKEGDIVKKGDVLCELASSNLQRDIETLEYRIKRNELLLSYVDRDEALAIQDAWIQLQREDKDRVESIRKTYEKLRIQYNDSLEFDRMELDAKKKELKAGRITASMDGTVHKLKDGLEGSTSKEGTVIMTLIDESTCLFEAKDLTYKDYFSEGTLVDMRILYSSASGDYLVLPADIDSWEDAMYFSVYSGPDNAAIEVGTSANIKITLDSRSSVLSVPKNTVKFVEDKAFVYTLNEDNIREIKYITTGLIGDDRIEIIDGLSEGEKVLLR